MVSRNRKIARRIGQAVANDVLDISGAISAGAGVTVYATADDLPTTGLTAGDEAFISGSNRLYISNGTGWYSIGLINTNPSITSVQDPSANTTPFTLATDGSALVLTITAADPEDVPLTYSYAVTTGSLTNGGGTTATVVQGTGANTNQFTITPTSTEAYAGTFELTFTASDGINQASSVNSFTLQFITTITNSKYTTLLATATGTSDNNNITDASSNNHSITVTGDAYAGTFSPFKWNGYSQYYDSNSYQIYNSWSDITGLSNVTIECWIYKTSHTSSYHSIMATRANGSNSAGFDMRFPSNSGILTVYYTGGGGVTSTTNMNLNTWYHVMFVRDGSTATLYIDGVQEDQNTSWTDRPGLTDLYIGTYARGNILLDGCINGYISDVRISNISRTAEVPEAPISVDSNTLFHIAGKHGPYDTSSSYYSPSFTGLSGANLINLYGPYNAPITGYSATDHGGSVFLGGTAHDSEDRLEITRDTSLTMGSGDFTYEAWVYLYSEDVTKEASLFSARASGYESFVLKVRNSGTEGTNLLVSNSTGNSWSVVNTKGGAVFANVWTHVAIVRNGTSIKVYTNGKEAQSHTFSGSLNEDNNTLYIGYDADSRYGLGHVSDVRITKGTAVYTTEFTPPTAPLSSSGASLLIKGTDASIVDKSQGANLQLIGNTTGSTTQVKFANTKSMYFDGTGDDIQFDTISLESDFTLEYWLKLSTYNSDAGVFGYTGTTNSQHRINHNGTFGKIMLYVNAYVHQTTGCFTQSEAEDWMHIAYSRQSGNLKLYVNGIQKDAVTATLTLDVDILGAGGNQGGNNHLNGYLQDFRITKGLARYTANFTPPTASLEG